MLDKTEVKALLRFTDEATDAELAERAAMYLEVIALLDAGDLKADFRFSLRLVREEQIARLQLRLANDVASKRDAERRRSGTF